MDYVIFLTLIGLAYLYKLLINRYIKLKKCQKKVKVFGKAKPEIIGIFVILIIIHTAFGFNVLGNSRFFIWCFISISEVFYVFLICINLRYIFIGEDYIIWASTVTNLKDYSYRINDNTIELLSCNPSAKIEKFVIKNDRELLIDILKDCKSIE